MQAYPPVEPPGSESGCGDGVSRLFTLLARHSRSENLEAFRLPKIKKYHCTDVGNAKFFRDFTAGNLIFNYRTQLWYEWTGYRWQPCLNGQAQEWAKRGVAEMYKHAANITDQKKRTAYISWALKSESAGRIGSMLDLGKSEKGIVDSGNEWDAEPMMIACPKGILDLRTGSFLAPDKKIKTMNCIALDPEPKASAPVWTHFLESTYEGDLELIGFIKRFLGYSLTGSVKEQCLLCLYGQGANGKSTLLDTIMRVFGSYGYTMPFSTIEHLTRSAISNDVAALYGKRYVVASETQEGVKLNEGRIKSLTGGEPLTARFMYRDYFTFEPVAHFILAFNHKPVIVDDTEGAWRRIHLVKHNRVFKASERDKDLPEKLKRELPGILNWLIEGCIEWQQGGLIVPRSVLEATEGYRQEMNPLRQFVEDVCTVGNFHVTVNELWSAYNEWADDAKEKYRLGRNSFNNRLESMGFERKPVRTSNKKLEKCWTGIGLEKNPRKGHGVNITVVN